MGKDAGCQTIVPSKDYISPKARASQPSDLPLDNPNWYQQPHTLGILCGCLAFFMVIGAVLDTYSLTPLQSTWAGLSAGSFIFFVCAVLQFPDGILVRPFLGFWRFMLGASILYLLLLTFLLFQDLENVKWVMSELEPNLKLNPKINEMREASCELSQMWDSLDIFVVAHFLGWLVKALIIRDFRILWFLSLAFEFVEKSLVHVLPNFFECWWDQMILDVFGCNLCGIVIGMKICDSLRMKQYTWGSRSQHREKTKKKKNFFLPSFLLPYEWTTYRWPLFLSDYRQFLGLIIYSTGVTMVDLNIFLIKAELHLPDKHWYNFFHCVFWSLIAAPTTREYYEYITDKNCKRLGLQCWLACSLVIAESLLAFRWRFGLPNNSSPPLWIPIFWSTFLGGVIVIAVYLYYKAEPSESDQEDKKKI